MGVLLEVEHLSVGFAEDGRGKNAVEDLSFVVNQGEILGLVGESGSGKSMTALTVMGIQPENARISGRIVFRGREISCLSENERNQIQIGRAHV